LERCSKTWLKLCCDERFTHAFTAYGCVFKEITLVGSNQRNYFENPTACSKHTLKTTVATQLKFRKVRKMNRTSTYNVFRVNCKKVLGDLNEMFAEFVFER
jgi:hypothetical protein